MKQLNQYFILELKKTFATFPKLLAGSFFLLVLTFLCIFFIRSSAEDGKKNPPVFVGVLAEKDEPFIDWIINTANNMPDMGYSVRIQKIDKKTAENNFFADDTHVLFIVPKNYISSIIHGENKSLTIRFSKTQMTVVNTLMKELADAASSFILDTESAMYSMHDYYQKYHLSGESKDDITLNLKYVQEIIRFSNALDVKKTGNGAETSLAGECLSSGIVLLPLIFCLMLLPLMMSEGISLKKNLARIGIHAWKQVLVKEAVIFLTIFASFLAIAILFLFLPKTDQVQNMIPEPVLSRSSEVFFLLFQCSPVFLFAAAFSCLLCETAGEVSGGMMLLFFSTIFLSLFSGLFYPLRYLPEALQNAAAFLPLKHAREYVLGLLSGHWNGTAFFILMLYSTGFFFLTLLLVLLQMRNSDSH